MQNSKILFFKKHRPYESNNIIFILPTDRPYCFILLTDRPYFFAVLPVDQKNNLVLPYLK